MKLNVYFGYRTPDGQYKDVRNINIIPQEELKNYINMMQEQVADTLGYKKSTLSGSKRKI